MNKPLILLFLFAGITISMSKRSANVPVKEKVVVIDVAHGGHDHGASSDLLNEKSIVSGVAAKLSLLAKQTKGLTLIFTRESDEYLSLEQRVDFINRVNPDLSISLHVNGGNSAEQGGVEAYVNAEHLQYQFAKDLAGKLVETVASKVKNEHSKVKESGFYLLKHVESPCVLLELGYLSNPMDEVYLSSEEGHMQMASAIIESLIED